MKKNVAGAAIVISSVVVFLFSRVPANAYSIYDATGSAPTNGLGTLAAPFQSFINNINSVGTNAVQLSVPSVPQNNVLTAGAESWLQSLFQQFDDWLYGIAGFHISGFFIAILNILSWVLSVVKDAVDWLLGLFH